MQLGSDNNKAGQRWCFVIICESGPAVYLEAFSSDQRNQWIEAINAFRKQVNANISRLESEIRAVQPAPAGMQ